MKGEYTQGFGTKDSKTKDDIIGQEQSFGPKEFTLGSHGSKQSSSLGPILSLKIRYILTFIVPYGLLCPNANLWKGGWRCK